MILVVDLSIHWLLKPYFARYRPCCNPELVNIRLVGSYIGVYGFPSAHAANTFAFATLFSKLFKYHTRLWIYSFWVWACLISYGRVYGGVHYLLDVIAGGCFGAIVAMVFYLLLKRTTTIHNKI